MSGRTTYHVVPNKSGWAVKKEGNNASNTFETKAEAVTRGRTLAKSHHPSQLIVHKEDGTIQTEYTYGNDPYPPAG